MTKLQTFNAMTLAALLALAAYGANAADSTDKTQAAAAQAAAAASAQAADQHTGNNKRAAADGTDKLAKGDRKFVEKAALGGMMEVKLGQLAKDKASHPEVKAFGERMVQDHGKANEELMQLISAKGIDVPKALDKAHQKDVDKLEKASAPGFDQQYMKLMVADHKKDVASFEKAARSLQDPELKAFAEKTLPTLKEHHQLAQRTSEAVRKSGN